MAKAPVFADYGKPLTFLAGASADECCIHGFCRESRGQFSEACLEQAGNASLAPSFDMSWIPYANVAQAACQGLRSHSNWY